MTDRAINFTAPMVRALLDGRKTMTRQVLKPQPGWVNNGVMSWRGTAAMVHAHKLPYAPGDRLWVREGWNVTFRDELAPGERIERSPEECFAANGGAGCACADGIVYAATGAQRHPEYGNARWRRSTNMPRWASRLTLIVTDVRVERLADISEADAIAEGVTKVRDHCYVVRGFGYDTSGLCHSQATTPFAQFWDSLNEERGLGWHTNPWVSVISFDAHRCNIDAMPAKASESEAA